MNNKYFRSIARQIQLKNVVPVLGPGIFSYFDNNELRPLEDKFLTELSKETGVEYDDEDLLQFLAKCDSSVNDDIYYTISQLNLKKYTFEAINHILSISQIKEVICTFPLNDLKQRMALAKGISEGDIQEIIFSDPATEIPPTSDYKIFNLFGKMSFEMINAAQGETELIEFLHVLASREKHIPYSDILKKIVKGKSLLFIGCDYGDWLFRFFIRIISNKSYLDRSARSMFILPHKHLDKGFTNFLSNHQNINIIEETHSLECINKFAADLRYETNRDDIRNNIRYEGKVFISFSGKNRDQAILVRNCLTAEGVEVWFDNDDMRSGDQYGKVISNSLLRECSKLFRTHYLENVLWR